MGSDGFVLEEYETFYEFTKYFDKDLTSMFIQFVEEYFTDYTSDRLQHQSDAEIVYVLCVANMRMHYHLPIEVI